MKRYVDRNVAHLDAKALYRAGGLSAAEPPDAPARKGSELTLNEVHDAIDLIGRLFQRYGNLLTAATWVELTPAIQHDWEAVLRMAWIEDGERD